jgi:hypothetical protein
MAQMKAVTVRVAKTNIVIGLSLRQRLPHLLTDGNCRDWRRRDLKRFTPRDPMPGRSPLGIDYLLVTLR